MPPTKIQIEVDHDDERHPIVCSFPSGIPDATAQFQWRKEGHHNICVIGRDKACHYQAVSSSKRPRSQMVVGIYDKTTKKLRLMPAAHQGYIFTVTQSVPNYTSELSRLNGAAEQYRALFQDFGSAKKQRAIRSKEANRVSVDAVVGADNFLNNAKATMSTSNQKRFAERQASTDATPTSQLAVLDSTMQWRRTFLPPFDETAKHPNQVYQLSDIAGPGAMQYLEKIVTICTGKPDIVEAMFHDPKAKEPWKPSLQKLLRRIVDKSSDTMEKQLQSVLLLSIWTKLYLILSKRRHVNAPTGRFFGQPSAVAERFLEQYTTQTTHHDAIKLSMSKANKDSCLVCLLILYCLAGSHGKLVTASIDKFAADLQVEMVTAQRLLRQAGFTVKGSTATLSTPLTFPTPKMKRGLRSK